MVAAALTEAAPWTSEGDEAIQFAKKMGIVQYWKNTIAAMNEDSFRLQVEVPCGVLFNKSEQTVLKLLLIDRIPLFDGQASQAQIKEGLLTVRCSSPFAISGGAAFSTTRNRQFAIVKGLSPSGRTSINTLIQRQGLEDIKKFGRSTGFSLLPSDRTLPQRPGSASKLTKLLPQLATSAPTWGADAFHPVLRTYCTQTTVTRPW